MAAENNGTHIYNPSYTVTRDSCVLRDSYPTEYLGTGYMTGDYDNGGVHLNSTVISHAAYLMSRGINGSAAFEELGTLELAELFYSALFSMPSDCTPVSYTHLSYPAPTEGSPASPCPAWSL